MWFWLLPKLSDACGGGFFCRRGRAKPSGHYKMDQRVLCAHLQSISHIGTGDTYLLPLVTKPDHRKNCQNERVHAGPFPSSGRASVGRSSFHTGKEYIIPVMAVCLLSSWSTPSIGIWQQQTIRLPCFLPLHLHLQQMQTGCSRLQNSCHSCVQR